MQRAVEKDRVQWVFARPFCRGFRKRHSACRNTVANRKLADRAKLVTVTETEIAHVAIKRVDVERLQTRELTVVFRFKS